MHGQEQKSTTRRRAARRKKRQGKNQMASVWGKKKPRGFKSGLGGAVQSSGCLTSSLAGLGKVSVILKYLGAVMHGSTYAVTAVVSM